MGVFRGFDPTERSVEGADGGPSLRWDDVPSLG